MVTIDVRDVKEGVVTTIIFADSDDSWITAVALVKEGVNSGVVGIQSDFGDETYKILNKEHAHNLIKALNKAIELGWLA